MRGCRVSSINNEKTQTKKSVFLSGVNTNYILQVSYISSPFSVNNPDCNSPLSKTPSFVLSHDENLEVYSNNSPRGLKNYRISIETEVDIPDRLMRQGEVHKTFVCVGGKGAFIPKTQNYL